MSFVGKVILITGAGSGIGADAARHLSKLGAKLAIVDVNKQGLTEVANQIKKSDGQTPLPLVADLTKDAERVVSETVQHFGKLDVLVNNAGIGWADNPLSIDMSKFDRVFDVNVRSLVTMTKLSIPHLEETKGNIVNTSSIAGFRPGVNMLSYCMSKAAVNQFTKCCALDLAPKKIRVNAINPGIIQTPIYDRSGLSPNEKEAMMKYGRKSCIIGRLGEVSDTSEAIAFLANDKTASFLTGILLPVDGGQMVTS